MCRLKSSVYWDKRPMQSVEIQPTLPHAFTMVSCLASSLGLKVEPTCSSEMSVHFSKDYTTLYILEDRTLQNHRYENLKSYMYVHYRLF
jgi:hypothetical protein